MNKKYQIVADENMPYIDKLFAEYADITKLPGREITANDVKNADALLCRSITPVNENLLKNSNIKFVGTATIGVDHLAIDWLDKNHISWASAAGCNAAAVAQYVISGICYWLKFSSDKVKYKSLQELTVGIVGAGNVGTELARCLTILGVKYFMCDPPLERLGDKRNFVSLDKIKQCDVITFHVPITMTGEDKTFHLIDAAFLTPMSKQQLLINAARGEVADNQALLNYLQSDEPDKLASIVLDVFENEPNINVELARHCLIATPHIAGHTLEGKLRGSYMVYLAFCERFNLPINIEQANLFPKPNVFINEELNEIDSFLSLYNIANDHQKFLAVSEKEIARHFDQMRKNYVNDFKNQPRRDYSGWSATNCHQSISALLNKAF